MTCTAHTVNPYNTPDISPLPQACGTDAADVEGGRGGGGARSMRSTAAGRDP